MTSNLTKRTTLLTLMLAFLVALMGAPAAFAQDYKEAYNQALVAAKAKQYSQAYTFFTTAATGAQQAGDSDVLNMSNKVLAQLDYRNGLQATKAEDFATAITHFEKGIGHHSINAKNYLGKALALKKLDRIDEAMTTFQQAAEVGQTNGDRKTARSAESAIRDHYVYMASATLSKDRPTSSDADAALAHLEAMQKFVEADADVYYYTAVAYNAKGMGAQALEMADKALELHKGSRTDKAKIYFVKGEILLSQQRLDEAKAAFRNAAYGSYKASAEHYLETIGS